MKPQLIVKTNRSHLSYKHYYRGNLPNETQTEMIRIITEYNKQLLNQRPGKNSLVTRVTVQSI